MLRGRPSRARRPAQRPAPVRDQVRRQHDDAHDARGALDHGHDAAGRRDRRHRPRPRGERRALAQRRRGPRDHRAHRGHPPGRRHARHRGLRRVPPRPPEARRVRLGLERRGDDQPGGRARPARARGGCAHVRRRGPRRAPPPDRRPGHRHGLPRLLGLQVLRAARRRALRPRRGARRPADVQAAPRVRPLRDRARSTTRGSPGRSPPWSTSPRSGAATAPRSRRRSRAWPAGAWTPTPGWPRSAPTRCRCSSASSTASRRSPARGSGASPTAPGSRSGRRPPPSPSRASRPRPSRRRSATAGSRRGPATSTPSGVTERLGLEPEGVLRIGLTHYNTAAEVDRLLAELRSIAAAPRPEGARAREPARPAPTSRSSARGSSGRRSRRSWPAAASA